MTRNILESDEVDSKIFAGRVITFLGEILNELKYQRKFLEDSFHLPPEDSPAMYDRDEMDEESEVEADE